MAKLKIRIYGDPVLRQEAEDVTEFDAGLEKFAGDMIETMLDADGIGLAAPQVGVSKRFLVIGLPVGEDEKSRKFFAMANPEILEESEDVVDMEEGCLSIPGINEEVERPEKIRVRFNNLSGETVELEAEGVFARVIQHEMDHLDGVLFIDHLPALKRTLLRGKLKKIKEEAQEAEKDAKRA